MNKSKIAPIYQKNGITIHNADCRKVLPLFPDKSFDLVLTDFPYANGTQYDNYDDTEENLILLIHDIMPELFRIGKRILLTCGVANMALYPRPDWTLCWFSPAGKGSGPWGFCCWQPILAYGKDPYLQNRLGRRPDAWQKIEVSKKCDHPCPKPLDFWTQLLLRGSVNGDDIILDPLMGSGTTLRAAKNTGRRAVGIELSSISCDVCINELAQEVLSLNSIPEGPKQTELAYKIKSSSEWVYPYKEE